MELKRNARVGLSTSTPNQMQMYAGITASLLSSCDA